MAVRFLNDFIVLPTHYVQLSAGDNDDVAINSSSVSFLLTADNDAVTGMVPPDDLSGPFCWISNGDVTGKTLIVKANDTGSVEANRFHFDVAGATTQLALENAQVQLFYYVADAGSLTGWWAERSGTFS